MVRIALGIIVGSSLMAAVVLYVATRPGPVPVADASEGVLMLCLTQKGVTRCAPYAEVRARLEAQNKVGEIRE